MRTTIALAITLLLSAAGCSSFPRSQPAPSAARDGKTPISPENPTITQRINGQRAQQAEVASGRLAVEGQLVR